MEQKCHKNLSDGESPRPYEYFCRSCGVVECLKCCVEEHTDVSCGMVRIAAVKTANVQEWCEELRQMTADAKAVSEEILQRDAKLTESVVVVMTKCKNVQNAITEPFDRLEEAIRNRRQQLLAEIVAEENRIIGNIPGVPTGVVNVGKSVKEICEISEELLRYGETVGQQTSIQLPDVVDFLRKKFDIDRQLKTDLPILVAAKTEELAKEIDQQSLDVPMFELNVDQIVESVSNLGHLSTQRNMENSGFGMFRVKSAAGSSDVADGHETAPLMPRVPTARKSTGNMSLRSKQLCQLAPRKSLANRWLDEKAKKEHQKRGSRSSKR